MKYCKISPNGVNEKNRVKWTSPKNDKWGKFVVDDSNFIPMSEQVKSVAKMQRLGNDIIETIYDFPDGKDTGAKIPFSRTRDGKGLAELSTYVNKESKDIQKKKDIAVKNAVKDAQFEAKLNSKQ